jgi:hypothetical protein
MHGYMRGVVEVRASYECQAAVRVEERHAYEEMGYDHTQGFIPPPYMMSFEGPDICYSF